MHVRPTTRIWTAVAGLALMVGSLSLLFLVTPPPAAAQQNQPPTVVFTAECVFNPVAQRDTVRTKATVTNPNADPTPDDPANGDGVTYQVVRTWSDGRAANTANLLVGWGQSKDSNHSDTTTAAANAYTVTLVVRVAGQDVAGPFTKPNPCVDEETTTTTTTTTTKTTTTTTTTTPPGGSNTTTTTTRPGGSTTTTTTGGSTTTTDAFGNPTTTTSAPVTPVSSTGDGGLAATGVAAVAVLAGIGVVLFANGAGLMRLVRRGGDEEDAA